MDGEIGTKKVKIIVQENRIRLKFIKKYEKTIVRAIFRFNVCRWFDK
jgi:hypothetical protein